MVRSVASTMPQYPLAEYRDVKKRQQNDVLIVTPLLTFESSAVAVASWEGGAGQVVNVENLPASG